MENFKMSKMQQIRFFFSLLPYYILGILKGIILAIKSYFESFKIMNKAKKEGNAVCYSGVQEGLIYFVKNFMMKQKPIILHTQTANLLLVHGSPSAKMPFIIGGLPASDIEAISGIEKGEYILVSCHNSFHQDINLDGVKAIREPNTISPYPILAVLNPFSNKIWLTSNKEVGQLYADMQGIDLETIEEGFDNTIWKGVERNVRVLSEDEVPDSVKAKINNHA